MTVTARTQSSSGSALEISDGVAALAATVDETLGSANRVATGLPTTTAYEIDAPVRTETVAVLGLGYVGLPTALALHGAGFEVLGIDRSVARLDRITAQDVDLLPHDRVRLAEALPQETFTLTADAARIAEADVVIVCVPTPIDERLLPDLAPLSGACEEYVRHARVGQLVVLTSTTYPGSTRDMLAQPLAARGLTVGVDVHVAFSPERINPGVATFEQSDVPRVVGGMTPACTARAAAVVGSISALVHTVSSPEAAELCKLFENTFRAVNASLVNEFASACAVFGEDVMEVLDAAATKPFGFMKFTPGPGVGGHCIPCDPHYLLWQLRAHRAYMPIVESAMKGISDRPLQVVDRVLSLLGTAGVSPVGARVLVAGVAYKPDVEDVRESPAIEIVERLMAAGVTVELADPHVPSMRLASGERLFCRPLSELDAADYDLVLVHTLHAAEDYAPLSRARILLDATYQLRSLPARITL